VVREGGRVLVRVNGQDAAKGQVGEPIAVRL
jgi:hypothetical protein